MRNERIFGLITLAAVLVFGFWGCDNGNGGGKGPQSVTYTGSKDGVTYKLKITENLNRAFQPQTGDTYELSINSKKSTGTVTAFEAGVFTLKPSNSELPFAASVTGRVLTGLTGTITWNDNTESDGPGDLTSNGGGDSKTFTYTASKDGAVYTLTITDNTGMAYEPQTGDTYQLSLGAKQSSGTVLAYNAGNCVMKPDNSDTTFFISFSGSSLTKINGTITWNDTTTSDGPGDLSTTGGPNYTVPGPVKNFTVAAGNGQTYLSWEYPQNSGGMGISGYEVTRDDWATVISTTGSSIYNDSLYRYIFPGLNGAAYTYKVRAINSIGTGEESTVTPTPIKKVDIEMVQINSGTFKMGSPDDEFDRSTNETQHDVILTKDFKMGKYPVTQEQWVSVMGINPSYFRPERPITAGEEYGKRPIEMINWYEAIVFCNYLSIIEGLTPAYNIAGTNPVNWGSVPDKVSVMWDNVTIENGSTGYRLPTEAQWEYACRAGTTTAYNTGDYISDDTGWYSGNSNKMSHEVGKKQANAWGLYDMHGNVFEWCWDWYVSYPTELQTDPSGGSGSNRTLRGGSWEFSGALTRSAARRSNSPNDRNTNYGFRVVRP